jgi:anti-sigma B factor antagonist
MEIQKSPALRKPASPARPAEVAVVRPEGELAISDLRALAQHCFRCAQEGVVEVVFDLEFVDHLDYRGVGMVCAARQLLVRQGGDLLLANVSPYLAAILRAAGAHGRLELCPSVAAARARFLDDEVRW